jgi:hypothetical protein
MCGNASTLGSDRAESIQLADNMIVLLTTAAAVNQSINISIITAPSVAMSHLQQRYICITLSHHCSVCAVILV